jgi:ATP-binding cassette subfamily B protein
VKRPGRIRWKLPSLSASKLRRITAEFRDDLRPYRGRLALVLLFMLGDAAMELLRPWPIKIVLDHVLIGKAPTGALGFLAEEAGGPSRLTLLWIACAAIVLVSTLGGAFVFGQTLLSASTGHKVLSRVRRRLYGHVLRLSLSYHDRARTGDLLVRLTGDITAVKDMLTTSLLGLGTKVAVLVGMAAIMTFMDPLLTLVSVAVIPLLLVSIGTFSRRVHEASTEQRRKEGRLAARIGETLHLISVVQAFGRAADEQERFSGTERKSLKAGLRAARAQAGMSRSVELTVALGTAAVLAVGGIRALGGMLTPGDLIVFIAYLRAMYRPLRSLSSDAARLAKGIACGERILEVLRATPEVRDLPDARPAPRLRGDVAFESVTFAYRAGEGVLRDVSFTIRAGEVVALVGESGAGKSTIASLIPRLYEPTSGIVRVGGEDVRRLTLDSLRAQIAIVPQQPLLFSGSIRENIAYGKPDATDEEIVRAAEIANAHDFIVAMADGYDTVVGERGVTLSGGERQRIAIARAAVRDAPIVILDEPASGLDAQSERLVTEALFRLLEGRTAILIAHRFATIEKADRILVIEDGRLVGDGARAELLEQNALYRRLHDLQVPR